MAVFNNLDRNSAYRRMSCGVSDQRLSKLMSLVLLYDRLNTAQYPDTRTQREMILRFMPDMTDLHRIMKAAQHLRLVDEYTIEERHVTGLAPDLATIYIYVRYSIGKEQFWIDRDCEILETRHVHVAEDTRCQIWVQLFFAAGYNVRLCSGIGQMINMQKDGCRVTGVNKDRIANALTYAFTRNGISCSIINT